MKPLIMKKVCAHYISTYLPLTENWIFTLVKNFVDYNPVMLSRKRDNIDKFPIHQIVSLSDLNKLRYNYNFVFFKTRKYFPVFKKLCLKNKASILHIHFGYHGIKSIKLKQKLKIPMVCSFYGNDAYINQDNDDYYRKLKLLFKQAEKILVLGPTMKERLIEIGCPDHKIQIHHLGIELNQIKFKKRTLPKNKNIRFMIASSFVPKKGIDDALKALHIIQNNLNFSLDIIGDGYLNEELRQMVGSLGLGERVTFHGYQPYENVLDLAHKSHVLLHPSKTAKNNDKEGTPMVIAAVMATGLPVVATYHSDIPELITNKVTGFLAKENNPKDFSNAILNLIEDRKKYEECSIRSRQHIEQEFDACLQSKKLELIYSELEQHKQ